MNPASWILLGVLIVVVALAIFFYIKGRKNGGCSCCSKKEGCPYCKHKK